MFCGRTLGYAADSNQPNEKQVVQIGFHKSQNRATEKAKNYVRINKITYECFVQGVEPFQITVRVQV